MPELDAIYTNEAEQYQRLVGREDHEGNILRAIQGLTPLEGRTVVEFGAGTGRLTMLLAPHVRLIEAYDTSEAMLAVARHRLQDAGLENWRLAVADHRKVPAADRSADLTIAGWTICYMAVWHPATWRDELALALAQMERVTKPGGLIVILETLGTGHETPHPPADLLEYFAALEAAGFASAAIRTDYQFESLAEAEELTRFFFGAELADRVAAEGLRILPECTGVWWRRRAA